MTRYTDDPAYAEIERLIFENGGWETVANKVGLSGHYLKSTCRRDRVLRRYWLDQLRRRFPKEQAPGAAGAPRA